MKSTTKQTRGYTQGARAEAAGETHRRIHDAFLDLVRSEWLEDITLAAVAEKAGVTVQTVIRRFGGKDGLVAAINTIVGPEIEARRNAAIGSIPGAMAALVDDYEISGDFTMRLLAQELRHASLKEVTDFGRAHHRAVTEKTFAAVLGRLKGAARERHLRTLIALTDVYVWQIYRRDMGLGQREVAALILEAVNRFNAAVLGTANREGSSP